MEKIEIYIRYSVGFLLWGSSAYLSILLFLSIAGGQVLRRIFMTLLAVALEGAKILAWRMGKKARLLAFALLGLSAIASFGAALQTVKESESDFTVTTIETMKNSDSYVALLNERRSIDDEISIMLTRLKNLPSNYFTATANLTSSLSTLRNRLAIIQQEIADYGKTEKAAMNESNIFVLISDVIGISPQKVLLFLLLFVSVCIEAGALLLAGNDKSIHLGFPMHLRPLSYRRPIDPTAFLEAASEGADLPYLHGRDATADKLGISSYQAKVLVRKLIDSGLVVVDGKRLKLENYTYSQTEKRFSRKM
jgi:hypothetical protein